MTTSAVWLTLVVVIDIAFRVIALVVVPHNRRPQTAMAWLLAIFFIPYFGFLAFIAFGSRRLPKARREKQITINHHLRTRSSLLPAGIIITPDTIAQTPTLPDWLGPLVRLNEHLGAMPMVQGNQMEFYPEYYRSLQEMTDAIDRATTSVHVEFYIMSHDQATTPFFEALERAVRRGLQVRVLYDHLASARITGYRGLTRVLDDMGARHQAMLPWQPWRGVYQRPDLRNHRKLLILDSRVAFTGSQNIIGPGYRNKKHKARGLAWLDLMVRVEGPLADSLEALFVSDWYQETGELLDTPVPQKTPTKRTHSLWAQVVPSGPAFEGENNLRLFNSLVYGAQSRLVLSSPYFVPDESMRYAITTAAERGVDVHLMVSETADQPMVFYAQRSYYEELLAAGVHVWLYKAPTILHAKFIIVDDAISVIGSSNVDMRSFILNLEASVLIASPTVAAELQGRADDYRANSTELTVEQWQQRKPYQRFIEGLCRLTATVQ
jgi:cardiolipin synthase